MKAFVTIIVGICVFLLLIVGVDGAIINAIIHSFPPAAAEWLGIIKVALWFLFFWFTAGIAFIISVLIASLVRIILD